MTYCLKLTIPDGATPAEHAAAEKRFRQALEAALGDAALVLPVHTAVQALLARHGDVPDPEALTVDERTLLEHWQMAETAAIEAVWGPHRHLDEGGYEIGPG